MPVSFSHRLALAAKAAVGVFTSDSVSQMHGMLSGMFHTGHGEPPTRGTSQQLAAYSHMPWLRAVTGKVASSVATTASGWQLFAPTSKRRRDVVAIQRSLVSGGSRRKEMIERRLDMGDLVEVEDHILLEALNRANSYLTGASLFKVSQLHLDLVGECFWGKERNRFGAPVAFWPIPANWIAETPTPTNRRFRVSWRGWQGDIPDTEILWMAEPDPWNPYGRGSGTARALADELETDEYAAKHIRAFFYNRARPDLIVYPKQTGPTDTGLRREEVDRLEESWMSKHSGFLRAFKPFFVGREIGVHEISQDFKNMEMSTLRERARDIVIQIYGVPPEQLGIIENSNRATIDASDFLFQKNVITPRMEFLRANIQERLIPEYDERLVIDYVSPIEEDREHNLKVASAAPYSLTVDEWREMQGLDPLDHNAGQVYAKPQTITLIRDVGQEADKAPAPLADPGRDINLPLDDDDADVPDDERTWHPSATKQLADDVDDLPELSRRVGRHEASRSREVRDALLRLDGDEDALTGALSRGMTMGHVLEVVDVEAWSRSMQPLLREMMFESWWEGARYGAEQADLTVQRDGIDWNRVNPEAEHWASTESAFRVAELGRVSRAVIQDVLGDAVREGWGAARTARELRFVIRLTSGQRRQFVRFVERLTESGVSPERIVSQQARWLDRAVKFRARSIARTELIRAANVGQQRLWEMGITQGLITTEVKRRWITSIDGRQDLDCELLDQKEVGMDEPFAGEGTSAVMTPPLHVNCRCAIGLVRR